MATSIDGNAAHNLKNPISEFSRLLARILPPEENSTKCDKKCQSGKCFPDTSDTFDTFFLIVSSRRNVRGSTKPHVHTSTVHISVTIGNCASKVSEVSAARIPPSVPPWPASAARANISQPQPISSPAVQDNKRGRWFVHTRYNPPP
jgi:hypothetical protein